MKSLSITIEGLAEIAGLTWALGMALYTAVSFVLYLWGVPPTTALVPALGVSLAADAAAIVALRAARRDDDPVAGGSRPIVTAGLGLALAGIAVTTWTALHSLLRDFDAWLVWGFKARMFALDGPPAGYFHDLAWPMHPDYPLNLPIAEALFLRLPAPLGLHLAALVSTACLAALLLLFYAGLSRLYGRDVAALATGVLPAIPWLSQWAGRGYADVPVALYAGSAALYLLLWWRGGHTIDWLLAGLLAGGAAWTKKEGLPVALLLVSACVVGEALRGGVPSAQRAFRIVSVSLAALALPLPWLIFSWTAHPLGGDFRPLTLSVFAAHADRLPRILSLFGQEATSVAHWSLFWIVLAAIVVATAGRLSRAGCGLLVVLVMQLGIYLIGYVFSDWASYEWHILTSLDRLMVQAAPLGLLVMVEATRSLSLPRPTLLRRQKEESRGLHVQSVALNERLVDPAVRRHQRATG